MTIEPYKSTPVFDQSSLPGAIRKVHSTKYGVWGHLRVLEGRVTHFHDPAHEVEAAPGNPTAIPPEVVHHVETHGATRMQVDFYRAEPPSIAS